MINASFQTLIRALLLALSLVLMPTSESLAEEELRPSVGKPLQAAQKLMAEGKHTEALPLIREAEAVGKLSPYESLIIHQMRGVALSGVGDSLGAVKSFEKVLASGKLAEEAALHLTQSIASIYLRAKKYPEAIKWIKKYAADGGTQAETLNYLPQAYYLAGDYRASARESAALISSLEQAGARPSEAQIKLLASALSKSNELNAYRQALERMLHYYPKPKYWQDLIQRTARKPGFSRNLDLDVLRLLRATDNIRTAREYMEMAQLALQARLPAEAKAVIEEGYEKKVLGSGETREIERQARLHKLVKERYAMDLESFSGADSALAETASGQVLLETGLAYVTYGMAEKGLQMMTLGMARGGLKFPGQAQLRLAYAYYYAGDKAKADAALSKVRGSDGSRELARLWRILIAGK